MLKFLQIVIPPRCKFLQSHTRIERAGWVGPVLGVRLGGVERKDRDKHIVAEMSQEEKKRRVLNPDELR